MKPLVTAVIFILAAPLLALAQSTEEQNTNHPPLALGYIFVGGATRSMGATGGFGGEFSDHTGLGVGLEAGAIGFNRTGKYYPSYTTGMGSLGLVYHYFPKSSKWPVSPFVAGGYTALFGHNSVPLGKDVMTNGVNIGGGADLFAPKHVGVRFDVRYYGHGGRILKNAYPGVAELSFVAFRIGLTFR